MGVSSAHPQETVRFGTREGVANNSANSTPMETSVMNTPAVGLCSRGYGSASFAECLDRLGEIASGSNPATCASEGAAGDDMSHTHTHTRQVVSPNSNQSLPQNSFQMPGPAREVDSRVRTEDSSAKCKEEEKSATSMHGRRVRREGRTRGYQLKQTQPSALPQMQPQPQELDNPA